MKPVKISQARGLIEFILRRTGFGGITLPWGVFILRERLRDHALIAHERVHVEQIQRMGILRFYLTYVWQWLRYGYQDMPLEKEARGEI